MNPTDRTNLRETRAIPTGPRRDRLQEVFDAALNCPESERAAYLAEACADDPALRERVERLLAAYERSEAVFEAPISPEIERELARLKPEEEGERIGRYKLLQEIGQGGFGTVWMAEQMEPVTRRVALKIIKMGMDTREVIGRFEQERQALAMMDHPNIAKVFDAGATPYGRPYFVMELVKGVPITEFCDERQLGTRERLELFADVCSAISHAHQKGIIHRDIKPSNVMITLHGDKPVVKVIDFGIAKATQGRLTDKTLFTRFEQFVGTPVYMSPEQTAMSGLDVDTRTDIYALGILLYELLTGKPPFDAQTLASAGYEEMRRIIREVEPPRPSLRLSTAVGDERTQFARARHIEPEKLSRVVEADLDWIVMKAIDKDRSRRYETASGFAEDVRRYLANEPVTAAAPSVTYRIRKFARRNKLVFAAGTAVLLTFTVGIAVSTWALFDENAALRVAQTEKGRAQAESKRAKAQEAKAKAQVREASRSDFATAQQRLSEGKWWEAVAYLGRAIRYDAENRNAQDALWLAHAPRPTRCGHASGSRARTQWHGPKCHLQFGRNPHGHRELRPDRASLGCGDGPAHWASSRTRRRRPQRRLQPGRNPRCHRELGQDHASVGREDRPTDPLYFQSRGIGLPLWLRPRPNPCRNREPVGEGRAANVGCEERSIHRLAFQTR